MSPAFTHACASAAAVDAISSGSPRRCAIASASSAIAQPAVDVEREERSRDLGQQDGDRRFGIALRERLERDRQPPVRRLVAPEEMLGRGGRRHERRAHVGLAGAEQVDAPRPAGRRSARGPRSSAAPAPARPGSGRAPRRRPRAAAAARPRTSAPPWRVRAARSSRRPRAGRRSPPRRPGPRTARRDARATPRPRRAPPARLGRTFVGDQPPAAAGGLVDGAPHERVPEGEAPRHAGRRAAAGCRAARRARSTPAAASSPAISYASSGSNGSPAIAPASSSAPRGRREGFELPDQRRRDRARHAAAAGHTVRGRAARGRCRAGELQGVERVPAALAEDGRVARGREVAGERAALGLAERGQLDHLHRGRGERRAQPR